MTDPTLALDLVVEDDGWKAGIADLESRIEAPLEAALAALRAKAPWPGPFEVSITFTDDSRIRVINHDYRGQDKATNVLAFPSWDGEDLGLLRAGELPPGQPDEMVIPMGDLIMARETVEREAREQGKSFTDHMSHLLVHGFLHLFGYDHMSDDEAEEMEALEVEILRALGISNPYLPVLEPADSQSPGSQIL